MHSTLAKTQPLDNLAPLAKANVPLLHVCGSLDPWFKDNTLEVESIRLSNAPVVPFGFVVDLSHERSGSSAKAAESGRGAEAGCRV